MATDSAGTDQGVERVGRLQETLLAQVRAVVSDQRPWTVVDYPMHLNCGDAALYRGLEELAAACNARVQRVLDRDSYHLDLVSPDSLPVFQAGGNWGGLYLTHHALRLRFLEDTRGRDVLQLAQSIEYANEQNREELRRAVDRHGRVTLLVRDQRSYDIAVRDYDCPVHLVPDVAFALGSLPRSAHTTPLRVQSRTDKESAGGRVDGEVFDWLLAPRGSRPWMTWQATMAVNRLQRRTAADLPRRATVAAAHLLAATSVERSRQLLSAGEVVVTDRLHGHVLSTLFGIPHVIVDDKFGKIRALRETWTAGDSTHEFAPGWEDVPDALERLRSRLP